MRSPLEALSQKPAGLRASFAERLAGIPAVAPALLLIAVLALLRIPGSVDTDVAWQLWIAHRINNGAGLYTDIVEVNPPLWFWMALPVDAVAGWLSIRPEPVLIVAVSFATACSIAATERLLPPGITKLHRILLLSYVALVLVFLPWLHAGEREQFALIAAVPYTALLAARHDGRHVPRGLAIAVGASAAMGFALKHYFLLVPLFLEAWLLASRRPWSWRRPETLALAGAGLAYGAAILLMVPDYLRQIVPLVRLTYGPVGAPGFGYLFGAYTTVGLLLFGGAIAAARGAPPSERSLATAILIATAGFIGAYFIQSKGWLYHAVPIIGGAAIAFAALVAQVRGPSAMMRVAAPGLLLLPVAISAEEQRHPSLPTPAIVHTVDGMRPGQSVGFLMVESATAWSVTLQHQLRFPSRYMGFWMLNAVVLNEQRPRPDPALAQLGRDVIANTVTDFRCLPPRRIIVDRPPLAKRMRGSFDILSFFLRDPDFAQIFRHYRLVSEDGFSVYELSTPLDVGPGDNCARDLSAA